MCKAPRSKGESDMPSKQSQAVWKIHAQNMNTCTYTSIYIYIYTYVYVYIYIHTLTHSKDLVNDGRVPIQVPTQVYRYIHIHTYI